MPNAPAEYCGTSGLDIFQEMDLLHDEMRRILGEASRIVSSLETALPDLAAASDLISHRLLAGGCLIVFGNGGSAAQAQHLAAEFLGRFQNDRKPLPAIALTADASALSAIANDYGFEEIFSRQLRALAKPNDVALAISTSGNSPNVLRAVDVAREMNVRTIGLTGRSGGAMRGRVDVCVCAPSDSTARIQEAHLVIAHILCQSVEASISHGHERR